MKKADFSGLQVQEEHPLLDQTHLTLKQWLNSEVVHFTCFPSMSMISFYMTAHRDQGHTILQRVQYKEDSHSKKGRENLHSP